MFNRYISLHYVIDCLFTNVIAYRGQLIIAIQFLQFSVKYLFYMYYIFTANLFMYID